MTAARVSTRLLAVLLTVAACSWVAAIFLPPLAHASFPLVTRTIDLIGALVCHQRDDRSFHLDGERLAVCGRCTGLYVAGAFGALMSWFGSARLQSNTRAILLIAAVPTAVTLAIEWSGLADPGNAGRALAGLPLGAAAGWLFVRMLRAEEQPDTCAIIT
jgi:uncharacterized membrane protein